jgi:hypothetical protein
MFLLHAPPAIAQSSSALERVSLPPNLVVPAMYRPLLETMLRDSPTFRRQCVRIAAEPGLTVHLTATPPPRRFDHRAMTRLTRDGQGHLTAGVNIGAFEDTPELIAHEFEHIIEQLDGVDLAARAAIAHTGVVAIGHRGAVFETIRAQRVGARVVSELRP